MLTTNCRQEWKQNPLKVQNNQPQVGTTSPKHSRNGEDDPLSFQVQRQCQGQMTPSMLLLFLASPTPDAYAVRARHKPPPQPALHVKPPPHPDSIFFPQTSAVLRAHLLPAPRPVRKVARWVEMSLQECAVPRSPAPSITYSRKRTRETRATASDCYLQLMSRGIKIREHSSSRSRTETPQTARPVPEPPCV